MPSPPAGSATTLGELARLFLKLRAIGFGGPAAHIAMVEDEVVRRGGWLAREEFRPRLGGDGRELSWSSSMSYQL